MNASAVIDRILVQWGDRLFYPGNRIAKSASSPRLDAGLQLKAKAIRRQIEAAVSRRAPQVVVKVSSGGRGMRAISVHFRYISQNGRLALEDERGEVRQGKESLHDLAERWRLGGSLIEEVSPRREALNLTLSMPRGTQAQAVLQATRAVALEELKDHCYVMVLHEHQAHPHVHLTVRIESMSGHRLYLLRTDIHRWRASFAEQLRGCGVEAEATRQWARGEGRYSEDLWKVRARDHGILRGNRTTKKSGDAYQRNRLEALNAWAHIVTALRASDDASDRMLAEQISAFIRASEFAKEHGSRPGPARPEHVAAAELQPNRSRTPGEPSIER